MSPVVPLQVSVPRTEVLRYMGYPRAKVPSPAVQLRLDALWPEAVRLVDARGAFVLAASDDAIAVGVPSPSERVAFGVCTIGIELEEQAQRYGDEGDGLGALILDAFGSAAAECAADALQARVCAAVHDDNLTASRRVSPGYGSWHVRRQEDLLGRLPIHEAGIRLTESWMMVPRKSVSFAVLLTEPKPGRVKQRCAACELVDCKYRRDESEVASMQETSAR